MQACITLGVDVYEGCCIDRKQALSTVPVLALQLGANRYCCMPLNVVDLSNILLTVQAELNELKDQVAKALEAVFDAI